MTTPSLSMIFQTVNVAHAGRIIFAIATIAFGVENFIYDDFVMGRAPAWPEGISGKLVWAYSSGVILIAAGIAMAARIRLKLAAIVVGMLVLVWALLRHILASNFQWGTELTWLGKALVLTGGAFAVAGSWPVKGNGSSEKVKNTHLLLMIGRWSFAIFVIICGIEHFMFVEFVKTLVPAWIPGNVFWTYTAGVLLIAGGAGLLLKRTAYLAGVLSGVMIFTWFIILHIPRAVAAANDGNEWIAVVEALAVSGVAFVCAGENKS